MYQNSFKNRQFSRRRSYPGNGRGFQNSRGRVKQRINSASYINKADSSPVEDSIPVKNSFADFPIDPRLRQNISLHGYRVPTPIQDQAIPYILAGRDLIGIANTGTGKTGAFLIPLINKIIHNKYERILIIIPTRELAVQINDELKVFSRSLNIYSVLVIGGASINRQISELRGNPHFIISTPGRLKDLINRRLLNLNQFKTIVLDEVDRMVDIGFINDIKFIISKLPLVRQSLFFSATVPQEVNSIIQSFLKNPVTVSVKVKETAHGIDQDVIHIKDKKEKFDKLQSMLRLEEFKKVLIFGRTKWGVERLSISLQQSGFLAASIHGNKSQNQRLRALTRFRQNQLQVLVATDVVARGMDIEDVSHVINYDEPSTYTDYVHRIGRTGRANKRGKALTFVG